MIVVSNPAASFAARSPVISTYSPAFKRVAGTSRLFSNASFQRFSCREDTVGQSFPANELRNHEPPVID